jgi:FixJ family two-component response regulator
MPIIFITAQADIPMTVQAMKSGAFDFLIKPLDTGVLLERVRTALESSVRVFQWHTRRARLVEREREVLILAVGGAGNKEIARKQGISHRTVEVHRSHILAKTGADSLLELANRPSPGRDVLRPFECSSDAASATPHADSPENSPRRRFA